MGHLNLSYRIETIPADCSGIKGDIIKYDMLIFSQNLFANC